MNSSNYQNIDAIKLGQLRPLPMPLATKAAIELCENKERVTHGLNVLREWAQQQAPFVKIRTTDQFLIVFLRAAKFSVEKAKQRLRHFYCYRTTMPEVFTGRNIRDPKVKKICEAGGILYLPDPAAEDGPRVVMMRPQYFDMNMHSIPDVFRVGAMAADALLYRDDNAIIAGYVFIMDLAAVPKSVLFSFDPIFARRVTVLVNKAMPARMKSFHFMNVPSVFESLFNMVKSVINTKLRDRFFVHGSNLETLYEHIPRHILPTEYGGEGDIESMKAQLWQLLNDHEEFFKDENSYGLIATNGNTIPLSSSSLLWYPQQKNKIEIEQDTTFGIAGSFRKLNLD